MEKSQLDILTEIKETLAELKAKVAEIEAQITDIESVKIINNNAGDLLAADDSAWDPIDISIDIESFGADASALYSPATPADTAPAQTSPADTAPADAATTDAALAQTVEAEPETALPQADDLPLEVADITEATADIPQEVEIIATAADIPQEVEVTATATDIQQESADEPAVLEEDKEPVLLGDVFGVQLRESINDKQEKKARKAVMDVMGDKCAWKTAIPGAPVKNIISAISLNDRVLFINTLFKEDPIAFQQTIGAFNAMTTLDEAEAFIRENHPDWNLNSDIVYRLMMAVRRKLK